MSGRTATLIGVSAIAGAIAAFPWLPGTPVVSYAGLLIGTSAVFLLTAPAIRRAALTGREVAVLLVLLFAVRAMFLCTPPLGSEDLYRYIWDGKVQAAGINPYRYATHDPQLIPLRGDTYARLAKREDIKTPYFPFAQAVFRTAYALSGEAVWGMKAVLLLAEAAAVAGLLLVLRHLRRPAGDVLLYAAAPLAIVQFGLDGHVDVLGFPLLVFGLLLVLTQRLIGGLVLLGLSMSVKPVAAVVLPLILFHEREWRRRAAVIVVPALVLVLQFLPYVATADVFAGMTAFARHWMFNGAVFSLVFALVPDNQRARLICGAMYATVLLALCLRSRDLVRSSVLAVFLLLLFSPVVHPWYVGWLAVLLPMAPRTSGIVWVSLVSLTSLTIATYHTTGAWIDDPLVRIAEYVPVAVLLAAELWREGGIGSRLRPALVPAETGGRRIGARPVAAPEVGGRSGRMEELNPTRES
jgi:hypothetical protein